MVVPLDSSIRRRYAIPLAPLRPGCLRVAINSSNERSQMLQPVPGRGSVSAGKYSCSRRMIIDCSIPPVHSQLAESDEDLPGTGGRLHDSSI
jgi:hypothetical protein